MIGKRTRARECALQILYQFDFNSYSDEIIEITFQELEIDDPDIKAFATSLIHGARKYLKEIDLLIEKTLINWRIERISTIDKALLRLGMFEIVKLEEIDKKVTISEILKLSKLYSDVDAPKFLNAILDRFEKTGSFENCLKAKK